VKLRVFFPYRVYIKKPLHFPSNPVSAFKEKNSGTDN